MRVNGVIETCLYVDDLQEARRFYLEVLGLEAFGEVPGRHIFMRCGNAMFLLFDPETTGSTEGEVPPHGARGPGHVAFSVPKADLPRWKDHLHELGIEVEAEVRWPSGGRSIYVRDPAGNSVELTSPETWGLDEMRGPDPQEEGKRG